MLESQGKEKDRHLQSRKGRHNLEVLNNQSMSSQHSVSPIKKSIFSGGAAPLNQPVSLNAELNADHQ